MAVTPDLLARLWSLDDLVELIRELGFAPRSEELGREARLRLGLPEATVIRAAILGGHGPLTVYAALVQGGRTALASAVESLSRRTRAAPSLFIAIETRPRVLAVACALPGDGGLRARQLRIGLERPSPVAAEILSGLAPRPGESALAAFARSADVLREEGLTARFFRELARMHAVSASALRDMPRSSAEERRDLALIVLTRVLFLYFVQAKGWLAGRNDFLPSLLDTALRRGHHFHRVVYEPLCFGALSAPLGARTGAARALGNVPFLNGGLFERHALERRFPSAFLPNETWRELLDDLFERFHFTLRENDDADAVDPEMLGRVFEGLMGRERRRASGTYFTPRDLLREMVSDALDAALSGHDARAGRPLRILDPAVGSGAFLLEALRQLHERLVPRPSRRDLVRDCLFGVDADPMAVRLAELRLWLALVVDDDASWDAVLPLPNLDRNLHQGDSLLSPFDVARATRFPATARLNAVAEQRAEYFTATGRRKRELARVLRDDERRLAADATQAELDTISARLADVAAMSPDLFGRRSRREARQQAQVTLWRRRRRELQAVRRRIADDDALPFFAYEVHFADVVARGGFDLVIGNPPWVRGERLSPGARSQLAARYTTFRTGGERGFAHLPDLSVAFVERAMELARPGGVVSFLVPAKLLRAGYAGALRAHLRRHATILRLDDRSHAASSGFAATVFPLVCLMRNAPARPHARVAVRVAGEREVTGATSIAELPLDIERPRSPWLAIPSDSAAALRSVLRSGRRLSSAFQPRLGVKTGANSVFLRAGADAECLPASCRVPAILGRDVAPFSFAPSSVMLAAVDARGIPLREAPADVARYLAPFRSLLAKRADAHGAPSWTLFRTDLLRSRWIVLWRDIAPRLEAAVLHRPNAAAPIPLNTCYGVCVDDAFTATWLAAWLNSPLVRTLAGVLAERASGGCFRFSGATVGLLPLPPASSEALGALARLGQGATDGKEWDNDELDRLTTSALGLPARTARRLVELGNAVRRDPGGHRRPALPGAGIG